MTDTGSYQFDETSINGHASFDCTERVFGWSAPDLNDQTQLDHIIALVGALLHHKENIVAALEYARGSHTFDDVAMRVLSGQSTLWVEGESFAITEIIDSPRKRSIHFFLAGGNREDMFALHLRMIRWARSQGIVEATLSGRVGWLKILEHMGWEEKHRTLTLDLSSKLPFEEE